MLDLIVKFFPWVWVLWTMREKKKNSSSIIRPELQTGENLSLLGVWLYLPVSIMSLCGYLYIRIFTNSFWASAVTGRIPEGSKWPLARAEISKWKKRERKRERDPATRFDWGLSYVWITAFKNLFRYSNSSLFVDIAVCRFNTNIQTTKWLVSKYMILLFK